MTWYAKSSNFSFKIKNRFKITAALMQKIKNLKIEACFSKSYHKKMISQPINPISSLNSSFGLILTIYKIVGRNDFLISCLVAIILTVF